MEDNPANLLLIKKITEEHTRLRMLSAGDGMANSSSILIMAQSYPLIPTLTPARGTPVGTPLLRSDPAAVPAGEGFFILLPPGEGQRVREQSGIIKMKLEFNR